MSLEELLCFLTGMEAAGLGVGVGGLIGLLGTCLDIIDRVSSYKDFGVESRSINTQFDADKLLLRKWAQNVGIQPGKLKDSHHKDLDDPEIAKMVEKILSSIREVFEKTESTFFRLQQPFEAKSNSPQGCDLFSPPSALKENTKVPRGRKIGWALTNKAKSIAQVQQFGALVQRLYSLVRPYSTKEMDDMQSSTMLGSGNCPSTFVV